jgi:streptogramin lyase
MKQFKANIIREYGPFPDAARIHGVSHDGRQVWFATDGAMMAFDPRSGAATRTLRIPADAGTAFDGRHLYQIAGAHIQKIDPQTGQIVSTIAAPMGAGNSGLAWADGMLWVGRYEDRKIHQIDPDTGAVLHTLASNRYVTGVTWADGELWHGTWEDGASELRQIATDTGEVLAAIEMPGETGVSGLESDGNGTFYCGGGASGLVRAVRRHGV